MSVNVVNFSGFEPGFIQSPLHCLGGTLPGLNGGSNMIGISAGSVGYHLSQNIGPSLLGMGKAFQDKDASSFTDDKAIVLGIKGAGGKLWLIVSGGYESAV